MRHHPQHQPDHDQRASGARGVTRLRRLRADDIAPLTRLLLFSGVDRRHLRAIAASTDVIGVAAGSVVATAGQRARELIAVLDGRVDAVHTSGLTVRLTTGDHIDGAAVFDRAHRSWTLTARTAATLLVIHPRAVDLTVLDIPGFEWRLRTADERRHGWVEHRLPASADEPQLQLR